MTRKSQLTQPGQMVACRSNVGEHLILWSSYDCEIEEANGYVDNNELLLVLEVKPPMKTKDPAIMEEWEKGAYKVLSPTGQCGWVGAGWVSPIK